MTADDRLSDSINKLTDERNAAQAEAKQLRIDLAAMQRALDEAQHRVTEAELGFPLGLWWVPDERRPDPRLRNMQDGWSA